ncbi:MAG: hypothetical protein ABR520_01825, partial [Mycobacteriales bacterium]
HMRRPVLAATAAAAVVAFASGASAAPDRSVKLSRDSRTASWTGDTGVGTYLGSPGPYERTTRCLEAVHGCDETLLRITAPGALTLRVEIDPSRAIPYWSSLRVNLYRSDASGRIGKPEPYKQGRDGKTVERVTPGYYLVEVEYMEGPGNYSATATLRPTRG